MDTICMELSPSEAAAFDVRFWCFVQANVDQLESAFIKLQSSIRDGSVERVVTFEVEGLTVELRALCAEFERPELKRA